MKRRRKQPPWIILAAMAPVLGLVVAILAAQTPSEAQGYGYFMKAAEFNAIAARMGCQTEMVDGDLLPMALTRVAECLQVRLTVIEGRLKKLEGRK